MSDPLLTAEDVAERLSVSRSTAYELMHRLRPHVRIGQGRKTLIRLPQSMTVCHRCDVTLCCNPDHMFLGTHRENMRDMAAKGRAPAQKGRAA